jgi:predicted negative regulator of RcsB-dependent stress response
VEDLTDNEREEQLRKWWSENWLWILGGIALGLAVLAGWQYWQKQRYAAAEAAAAGYSTVIESLGRDDRAAAGEQAKALRSGHPDSPYADQADLALARAAVDRKEFDEAIRLLQGVADGSPDAELRQVARTRVARVMIEQGRYDEALGMLDPGAAGSFAALYREIRGDALLGKGDPAGALAEYEAALAADDTESRIDRDFVALKRDSLSTPQPGEAAAQ